MMGRELSGLSYPQIGISDGHHPISHNNYDIKQMGKKAKVDAYNLSLFAGFLQRLKSTPEGDSNLLEHSLFVYGSGMSDGNVHNHLNLPVLVAGNAGGQITGGHHIQVGQLAEKRTSAGRAEVREDDADREPHGQRAAAVRHRQRELRRRAVREQRQRHARLSAAFEGETA